MVESGEAVDVAELTARLGFNHNAIRQHLAKLVDAGLVVESSTRAVGRGRPKLIYQPDPTADSRWGVSGPYERLSGLLAEVVRTGETPIEVGRRSVDRQRIGGPTSATDPIMPLVDEMNWHGFEPERGEAVIGSRPRSEHARSRAPPISIRTPCATCISAWRSASPNWSTGS